MIPTLPANFQLDPFAGLWCYLGAQFRLDDSTAQDLARALAAHGIKTWQQWAQEAGQ